MTAVEYPRVRLKYAPSPTLARFHRSQALFRGVMGPIGSGKSVGNCNELFRMAKLQEPFEGVRSTRWGVIRATYPELKSTTIKTWQDWFPPSICPFRYDSPITARMQFPLPDGTTLDMELVFVAVEREEDTRKLLSMELTGVWFNEIRELPFGIVKDAMGRIGRYPAMKRGGHTRKAAIADTNAPDDDSWYYRLAEEGRLDEEMAAITKADFDFFKQPPALIKTEQGYAPNPAAENIKNLKDGYRYYLDQIPGRDSEWIKVYILGEYGVVKHGKPVYGSTYNDSLHCSPVGFEPMRKWPLVVCMDFGGTPAAVFLQQTPGGVIRAVEEIVTDQSDARQICRDMIRPRLLTAYKGCTVYVTGDPSGTQRSQTQSDTVYEVIRQELGDIVADIVPADSNFLSVRIDAVKRVLCRLIDGKPALLLSPECKVLRKGFRGEYRYKEIRVAGGQIRHQETPEKNMASHVSEALQYGVMYLLGGITSSLKAGYVRSSKSYVAADPVAGL